MYATTHKVAFQKKNRKKMPVRFCKVRNPSSIRSAELTANCRSSEKKSVKWDKSCNHQEVCKGGVRIFGPCFSSFLRTLLMVRPSFMLVPRRRSTSCGSSKCCHVRALSAEGGVSMDASGFILTGRLNDVGHMQLKLKRLLYRLKKSIRLLSILSSQQQALK